MNEARQPSPRASEETGPRRRRTRLRIGIVLAAVVALLAVVAYLLAPRIDAYATDGEIAVAGLDAPVRVVRDGHGMPYLFAATWDDAFFAQGWVTAQDRLFQLHLFRLAAQGRLTELAGDGAREVDIRRRTLGFHHLAKRQARRLSPRSRQGLQRFADGVNAYIAERGDEHPLAFRLADLEPEPWDVEDTLSILFYFGWNSAANLRHELVAQSLVDAVGEVEARKLFPLNFNPDDPADLAEEGMPARDDGVAKDPGSAAASLDETWLEDPLLRGLLELPSRRLGSNNWAVGGEISASGRPMVANDPHLDPRTLPGIWYPLGLIVADERVVGAAVPGAPGITLGRNRHLAWAVTNAYADTQDLFVETLDPERPDRYLEPRSDGGGVLSVPFERRTEILRIRDDAADAGFREEAFEVRATRRGPVVSGVFGEADTTGRVLSLGWTAASAIDPEIGMDRLFRARTFEEADAAVAEIGTISLNYVWAGTDGRLGWRVSGLVPRRVDGAGVLPWPVDEGAAWQGWIPADEMPRAVVEPGAPRPWLGTANHFTVTSDREGYFTNYASPSYRYRRLRQLLGTDTELDVDDHWRFQRDARNLMARSLAPILARALAEDDNTGELGRLLAAWDHVDAADRPEPLIFQAVYRRFALETFRDELGEATASALLADWYFWQERFERMVHDGDSPYFDDTTTAERESRDDLIRRAGVAVLAELEERLGADPAAWRWGALHRLDFRDPLLRGEGLPARLLGGGSHAMGGSGETLLRGWYDFDDPFAVTHTASLRMVVDLGDDEKIRAVLPGGVSERLFHPHRMDQVDAFLSGEPVYWWWSDGAIEAHAESELRLVPAG